MIELYNADCLEKMKDIEDNSIDLVLIDPPYNIGKDKWDKWKTVEDYVEFMGKCFKEIERVLKDNGSFYFFHNDFLQVVELQNWINKNTGFQFKNFLIWNKRYNGSPRKYYFDNVIATNSNRSHRQLTEYCLFYTFQDDTGLKKIMRGQDTNNFKNIREYCKKTQEYIGLTQRQITKHLGNRRAEHFFSHSTIQWEMCTEKTYNDLVEAFHIDMMKGFRDWEDLREEYEGLRQEYEKIRYTFNNQKIHHDVLDFEVAPKQGHITPKPVDLLEYLIKTSSNEGDLVLDCFMGSGSTGVACKHLNRNFIGIEKEEKYFKIAEERVNNE